MSAIEQKFLGAGYNTFLLFFSHSHVVNVFLLIYQLGTCCVYVVFVSSNIKAIADYYTETDTDVRLYMLIILLPLILINWVGKATCQRVHSLLFLLKRILIQLFVSFFRPFWLVARLCRLEI